jgi:kynurenine formamidase
MTRRLIEVSHEIEAGMITYPGLPGPELEDHLSRAASADRYAPGTTFQIGRVSLIANTGTYVDSPFHRYEGGADLAALPLERLADLDGVVVDLREREGRAIGAEAFAGLTLAGRAVLVQTGWDAHWRTPGYGVGHPFLTRAAVEHLIARRATLVGIDSLNIDSTEDGARPAHTLLLGAGIPIVEHLCDLHRLPPAGFRFHCAPIRFRGVGSFPVRAYAVIES